MSADNAAAGPSEPASTQNRDALTKLWGRGAFDVDLRAGISKSSGPACPLSLVMIDVDHFKRVNDSQGGHLKGDHVLSEVARRIDSVTAGKGEAYRYGGEEFAVILPNHSTSEALAVSERIRSTIELEQIG